MCRTRDGRICTPKLRGDLKMGALMGTALIVAVGIALIAAVGIAGVADVLFGF